MTPFTSAPEPQAIGWRMTSKVEHGASFDRWLQIRAECLAGGMTGSIAPIFHGAIGYNSIEQEYDRRVNDTPKEEPGFMATRGRALEPLILQEVLSIPVADRPLRFELLKHPLFIQHHDHQWAYCSPDFLAYSTCKEVAQQIGTQIGHRSRAELVRIVGEIKSRDGTQLSRYKGDLYQLSERVQLAWNMACTDADAGLLIVMVFADPLFRIQKRDLVFESELMRSADRFLIAVQEQDVSALIDLATNAEERWDLVCATFTDTTEPAEDPDPAVDHMIDELLKYKAQKKEAEIQIKRRSAMIGQAIKGAKRTLTDRYSISWPVMKTGKRGGLRIKEVDQNVQP